MIRQQSLRQLRQAIRQNRFNLVEFDGIRIATLVIGQRGKGGVKMILRWLLFAGYAYYVAKIAMDAITYARHEDWKVRARIIIFMVWGLAVGIALIFDY